MKFLRSQPSTAAVLAAVAMLCGGAFVLFASGSNAAQEVAATSRPALTVTTVRPQTTQLPIRLTANGSITAWQDAIVGAQAAGLRLTEVRVNVGDVVKKGQVLATFAGETVQAEAAQLRASLAEAEAAAADSAANAQRARTLAQSGALSAAQIAQYQTAEQTGKARVEAARATLNAQLVRVGYAQVLAPDSGVISARSATVGAVVGAGTELFRLIRQGRLEWRAEVTSAELARLAPGTPARVTAASGAEVRGKVRMIAPTVDPQTRNGLVYVDLPSIGTRTGAAGRMEVLPGMFARGEFELGASPALTVPQQAVVARDGFNYVFRMRPDQRVAMAKIEVGRRIGDQVEVLGGLPADAELVGTGAGFLVDGDLVRVVQAPAAGAAAPMAGPASPPASAPASTPAAAARPAAK